MAALPVRAPNLSPAALESRILASPDHPYQGYVENDGRLDLPQLPQLSAVSSLLSGTTMMRTWFSSAQQWRTDVVTPTGEQDTYQTSQGTATWNFETGQITRVSGSSSTRLPEPEDFVPAQLALRVLHTAGKGVAVSSLPPQRIAGIAADGLEITPSADSTIGRVDIWADPATGVPLEASIYARGASSPALSSRFLDVELTAPAAATVAFKPAAGIPTAKTDTSAANALLLFLSPYSLPQTLAGKKQAPLPGSGPQNLSETGGSPGGGSGGVVLQNPGGTAVVIPDPGVGSITFYTVVDAQVLTYGTGLSSFIVAGLVTSAGSSAMSAATSAGAPVTFADGTGILIRTPLLTLLLVKTTHSGYYLLTGFVAPAVLVQAAGDLLNGLTEPLQIYSSAPWICASGASPNAVSAQCKPTPEGTPTP